MCEGKKEILLGDCLELMKQLPNESINMILCDLPYGTTKCKWDTIIPFEPLWQEYERLIKPNGAIVLTASQPFTSALVMSNPKIFKYEIIWEKDKPSDFAVSKFRTMKYHESVLIFSKGRETYNPQMTLGKPNHSVGKGIRKKNNESGANTAIVTNKTDGLKHPKSIIKFNRESKPFHPTQKPVELFEYLIKTYSNENDLILDNCAGSGTAAVACLNTKRQFIVMEQDPNYFEKIKERLENFNKSFLPLTLFSDENQALHIAHVSGSVCDCGKKDRTNYEVNIGRCDYCLKDIAN